MMKWFASSFSSLQGFMKRAGDFVALSEVMNLLSIMEREGSRDLEGICKQDFTFPSPTELGEPSKATKYASRHFMDGF